MADSRAAAAQHALHAPAWPLEAYRALRLFRLARREAATTLLHSAPLLQQATAQLLPLPPGGAFAARTALTQRRLGRVLAAGVGLEALTAAAEGDVRFAGAAAQRAAAAGPAARALLRDEVVAARLHQAELTHALLVRGVVWGGVCLALGVLGAYVEQRRRPFGAPNAAAFRVYLGLACTALSLAILSTALQSYLSLRAITAAIDALGALPPLPLAQGADAEAGEGAGKALGSSSSSGSGSGSGSSAVALNPLAAAGAGAAVGEWAAPRAPAAAAAGAAPRPLQQQSFAEAVGALGASVPPAQLRARWGAALADLQALRDRERMRAVGEALFLLLAGVGAVGALAFALSASTLGQFRWFTGGAFALAWLTGLLPALAGARARVEARLALAEGARVLAAGLRLGSYITAPPACSARALGRLLLCPCRLMQASPSALP